jgi:hypothetical protein
MLAVLPAQGHDLLDLERELAESPEAVDAALFLRVIGVAWKDGHGYIDKKGRTAWKTVN